jgi:hypothetical protein
MNIDWNPSHPRHSLLGEWDKFVGPGQTRAEFWLILAPSMLAALGMAAYAHFQGLPWNGLQYGIAMLMAFDLTGGIVCNATTAAKRWYHRPGQGLVQHISFIAVHIVYFFLVAWLFRGMDWLYFAVFSVLLLGFSLVAMAVPLYLQRAVTLLLYAIVLVVALYGFSAISGLEWFIPFIFLKLLVSHLPKEAPYPPESKG